MFEVTSHSRLFLTWIDVWNLPVALKILINQECLRKFWNANFYSLAMKEVLEKKYFEFVYYPFSYSFLNISKEEIAKVKCQA